jgi:hypothetical protein
MMREGSSAVDQQLVDVGGYRLALQQRGVGSPTVVLDAGMAQSLRPPRRRPVCMAEAADRTPTAGRPLAPAIGPTDQVMTVIDTDLQRQPDAVPYY